MVSSKKFAMGAAGAAGGDALNVEDVFSTYLYDGNGTTKTITNGIDLSGEGGMVWTKNRDLSVNHNLTYTDSTSDRLFSNLTNAADTAGSNWSYASDGYSVTGNNTQYNYSGSNFASWTFRKAPKFFDVVTYTGTGSVQNISHNLGCDVGSIIVKRTDTNYFWAVYHRGNSTPQSKWLRLDTSASASTSTYIWNNTAPTSTQFTVGVNDAVNASGGTYVAYLFAHNNSDGEFGPTGDQDIIKCGSFTTNGVVNLGFEPQWLMFKRTDNNGAWMIVDNMRGLTPSSDPDALLFPDQTNAESTGTDVVRDLTATSFKTNLGYGGIYIAIRRGPMAVPESATDVFDATAYTSNGTNGRVISSTPSVVDLILNLQRDGFNTSVFYDRLRGSKKELSGRLTAEEKTASNEGVTLDTNQGTVVNNAGHYDYPNYGTEDQVLYSWKRAPNYFDIVAYSGNSTAGRTVSHNLGVEPEMMWVKSRDSSFNWVVYHKDIIPGGTTNQYYLKLNSNVARSNSESPWNSTDPAATQFTLGNWQEVNRSGDDFIAYLFATVAGISKVGGYTGTGYSATIDCGFTSGARFVLIKNVEQSENWYVFDTERGIVSGNDNFLELNTSNAENPYNDWIDPHNSGFIVNSGLVNSGRDYVFYAIA